MMSSRVVLACMVALFAVAPAYADDVFPLGVWTDARQRMVVRITPCEAGGATYCGTIVQDNRRGRPTNPAGHVVIRSLAPARQHWAGQAYDGALRLNFTLHPSANGDVKARLCLTHLLCLNEKLQRVSTLVAR
jgi:uncharacterized protein (DUF2147 family)